MKDKIPQKQKNSRGIKTALWWDGLTPEDFSVFERCINESKESTCV